MKVVVVGGVGVGVIVVVVLRMIEVANEIGFCQKDVSKR